MNDEKTDAEAEKRRDDALRRALNTPPKPKSKPKDDENHGKNEKPSR